MKITIRPNDLEKKEGIKGYNKDNKIKCPYNSEKKKTAAMIVTSIEATHMQIKDIYLPLLLETVNSPNLQLRSLKE